MWDTKWLRDYGDFIQMGLMFPSCIAVGTGMGYFADRWLHTDPWCKIGGFVLGVVAGFMSFYRDYQNLQNKEKK